MYYSPNGHHSPNGQHLPVAYSLLMRLSSGELTGTEAKVWCWLVDRTAAHGSSEHSFTHADVAELLGLSSSDKVGLALKKLKNLGWVEYTHGLRGKRISTVTIIFGDGDFTEEADEVEDGDDGWGEIDREVVLEITTESALDRLGVVDPELALERSDERDALAAEVISTMPVLTEASAVYAAAMAYRLQGDPSTFARVNVALSSWTPATAEEAVESARRETANYLSAA